MNARLLTILFLCIMTLAAGCSSGITVQHDYDTRVDFSQIRSFDFLPPPEGVEINQSLHNRIMKEVTSALDQKGIVRDVDHPDVLLALHTQSDARMQVHSWGYHYAPYNLYAQPYGYWGMGTIDVERYEQGTLIIDMVKAEDMTMIWRGVARSALPTQPSPDKINELLRNAVGKIFRSFPPERGK